MTLKKPMIAMMQPTFLPWAGYFAMLEMVDVFIFLDDFQFSRQSYHQRNRLFVSEKKSGWVTLPTTHTKDDSTKIKSITLLEAKPVIDDKFLSRFYGVLESNYKKTENYAQMRNFVDQWLNVEWNNLADMNMDFIQQVAELLEIQVEYVKSSKLVVEGERSTRVVEILRSVDAKSYLCAQGSFDYMNKDDVFPIEDVELGYFNFEGLPYKQQQSEDFIPHLSVLDGLFQVGPTALRDTILKGIGTPKTWDEMSALLPRQS